MLSLIEIFVKDKISAVLFCAETLEKSQTVSALYVTGWVRRICMVIEEVWEAHLGEIVSSFSELLLRLANFIRHSKKVLSVITV